MGGMRGAMMGGRGHGIDLSDDDNTLAIAWANFGERGDPPEWNTPEGPELDAPAYLIGIDAISPSGTSMHPGSACSS